MERSQSPLLQPADRQVYLRCIQAGITSFDDASWHALTMAEQSLGLNLPRPIGTPTARSAAPYGGLATHAKPPLHAAMKENSLPGKNGASRRSGRA